ncbi:Calpain B, putative [Pediculus humanus corporis]|uniref:Calpain B, putative n=1 Tax=Pediculus humanus subsp. corporis TaxID=121224 RepID=E0W233_PEDHC|nr:Calpain B, putative [Pediculus humanus corporis]EEB19689.1 Calpain B, putative [Pediculus humanus corporis]
MCQILYLEKLKLGERGSGIRSKGQVQDFYELRDECLQSGTLFEDPDFPCEDSSIFFSSRPRMRFEWKRPMEIIDDPQLFVEGVSRFDVQQGELGDCWLLAAVANLTLHQSLFYQIVPADQDFEEDYIGIFHFRFWQYGKWVDVVIDDRLPTVNGKLVFLHSSQPNEFWSALLEKAYAKLHGSYEALKGGSTCEAMEDFTGGVTEMYDLNENAPPNLFKMMMKAYERSSLMGCSIEPDPNILEAQTPQGLVKGHAYTDITTPNMSGKIPLIRLRNPWGNDTEWNGPWSDRSPEWRFIPEHVKEEIGLTFDQDGEFWMCFKDFMHYFDRLEICNLNPDSLTEEEQIGKKKWDVSVFEGEWVRGVTAGGCRNHLQTFHHNPQYRITLTDADEDDEENKCTLIVALMQKNRRSQRNMGVECLTIGFAIYKLDDPDRLPKPLNLDFFKYNASCARSPSFINLREVSCRFSLSPGVYCIIPSTFDPNEEGEFILRVFSENKTYMEQVSFFIIIIILDERVIEPTVPENRDEQREKDERIRQFFSKLAGEDNEIDWRELQEILNYAMREVIQASLNCLQRVSSFSNSKFLSMDPHFSNSRSQNKSTLDGFSRDVCRSMIAMLDVDRSGKLGFEEFKSLWTDIRNWKAVFKLYDKQNTGQLSAFELREALNSAGYRLNNHILNVLVHRYGTKEGSITFDDFMMCAVKLKSMIDLFKEKDPDNTNHVTFSLEEWIERTLYS